jgi:hypothetical protein
MKKILFIAFLILSQIKLYSQTNYFNKIYDPNLSAATGYSISPNHSGYVVLAMVNDSIIYKYNIGIFQLDTLGNILFWKEYKHDSADYYIGGAGGGGFAKYSSGGYILAGNIVLGNQVKIFLMRLNNNFDTLWTKILYDDTVYMALRQCIETSDHGFALCGEKKVYNQPTYATQAFMIKTDSLGNIEYEKLYNITGGHNGDKCDDASRITETPDRGFLLGCITYDILQQGNGDPVVIKTDSLGNVKWIKNFGSNEKELTANVHVCKDSNYLVASMWSTYTSLGNEVWRAKIHLSKLRPDGSIIWEKIYEPDFAFLTIYKIVEYNNGDFVITGIKEDIFYNTGAFVTYLLKVNSNGDSIWYRNIYHETNLTTIPDVNDVLNIETTQDGSIVGCGKVLKVNYIPQSMWVFKTDSLGCLQPGCQYVGVEELQKAKAGELKINPNPATTQTTITYMQLNKESQLQIYNMMGQMVYEEKLSKGSMQTTVDTRAYKKGLYKVVVGESGGTLIVN